MTFFLVIDLVLRIFPFFSNIFRMFTMLNVVYDHFLQCMGGPPTSNFGGTVPPVPLGLRPWLGRKEALQINCSKPINISDI